MVGWGRPARGQRSHRGPCASFPNPPFFPPALLLVGAMLVAFVQ